MKLISFKIILICLVTSSLIYAQKKIKTEAEADIVEYSDKDGLPTTNFSNIVETKDGYLWISGLEGTFRFNGYEFEEVGTEFDVHKMQASYYDVANDVLYFASPEKFVILKNNKFQVFGKNEGYKINGLEGQAVNFVRADSKGRIWIGSSTPYIDNEFNGGLTKFENGKFIVYDSTSFPLHNASGFVETPYGDIIFASAGRNTRSYEGAYIALYKDEKFERIDESKGFSLVYADLDPNFSNGIIDEKGNTWIAFSGTRKLGDATTISNTGVLMYDGSRLHQFPGLEKYLNSDRGVSSIYYDSKYNDIYAVGFKTRTELFNNDNKMIFKFEDGEWINSDILKNLGTIKTMNTGNALDDYY